MKENGQYRGKTTDQLPAPEAAIEMVACGCKSGCTTNRCKCKKNSLKCTEMCICIDCINITDNSRIDN